jgi:glutathione S-transferase
VSDRFSLADLVMAVAFEYIDFRYPHDWRSRHTRLAQWLAGVSARPSLIETRPPGMEKK